MNLKRGLVVGLFVLTGLCAIPASALAVPQVTPTNHQLNFPVTPLNVESAPKTITVTNPSADAPLVFGDMAFYGGNDDPQFSFDRTDCPATLANGASCDIEVTFKPTYYDNHYKELGIGFAGFSTVYVALIGSTPNPDGEISPDTDQDFGTAIAGFPADAKTKTFTLSSTGERDLTLTELYAFNFNDLNFSVAEPTPCLAALAPGATCEFEVAFSPEEISSGLLDSTLTAQWDDPELHTLLVNLTGTATTANYTAAPATADFGEAEIGTGLTADRTPKSFTVTSTGDGDLPFAGAEVTGADAGSFSLDSPTCPARIAPTKTCSLIVTFDPETGYDGPRAATLKVKAGINDSKYTAIPLTGTATGSPIPPPPPGKAKLGLKLKSKKTVKRGKTLIVKATVRNTGTATAKSIVLKAKLPKKLVKKVKAVKIASLAPGKSVTRKIKVKVKRTAKRGQKLQLKVNAQAPGAFKASAKRTVKIK